MDGRPRTRADRVTGGVLVADLLLAVMLLLLLGTSSLNTGAQAAVCDYPSAPESVAGGGAEHVHHVELCSTGLFRTAEARRVVFSVRR